jgi:hypothetical protein
MKISRAIYTQILPYISYMMGGIPKPYPKGKFLKIFYNLFLGYIKKDIPAQH